MRGLELVRRFLSEADIHEVNELAEADECGVAFELMIAQLGHYGIRLDGDTFVVFEHLAAKTTKWSVEKLRPT